MRSLQVQWQDIYSFENLHNAYVKSKKKRTYKTEILPFTFNLEKELFALSEELQNQTYVLSPYKSFIRLDPKKRLIKALIFRDRVVQHAICNHLDPYYENRLIHNTFACRQEKGTNKALHVLRNDIYSHFQNDGYALKCDIRKFFYSINHDILQSFVNKRIKNTELKWLLHQIIRSDHSIYGENKGIPIGNLTSQLFANLYLGILDTYMKFVLREKFYYRYMDDFIVLHSDKTHLHNVKKKIKLFLQTLDLELHAQKQQVFPIRTSVDFVGYKIFPHTTKVRSSNIRRLRTRIRAFKKKYKQHNITSDEYELQIRMQKASWNGYAKIADATNLTKKLIDF